MLYFSPSNRYNWGRGLGEHAFKTWRIYGGGSREGVVCLEESNEKRVDLHAPSLAAGDKRRVRDPGT